MKIEIPGPTKTNYKTIGTIFQEARPWITRVKISDLKSPLESSNFPRKYKD